MKTLRLFIIAVVLFLSGIQYLSSQTEIVKESRKAQVTFTYPLGSEGVSSRSYSYNFSLNVLLGLNGGVNGFELGSLWNHNDGDVNGVQLSGIVNSTIGNSSGLILSGLVNYNYHAASAVAISGILNYSREYLRGVLLSGIANIGLDSLNGISVSGILNLTNGNARGIHLSTINLAKDFEGAQIGVVNSARRLKGLQAGVINVIEDGKNALPIGLINIVRNGYYELDLAGGEAIYSNLNFKMGVERLYSILKLGYSFYQDNPVYSFGFGLGTSVSLTDRQSLNIDLSTNRIFMDINRDWFENSNGLNKLDLNYKFYILNKLSFLIGPSYNIYVTEKKINGEYGTINIPYTLYEHEYASKKLFMWVGLNAGVSLKF